MKAAAPGTPLRAKQLQQHAKGLAHGKGPIFNSAVAKLAKMKLTPAEHLYVQSKVHEHQLSKAFPKAKSLPGFKPPKPLHLPHEHGGGIGSMIEAIGSGVAHAGLHGLETAYTATGGRLVNDVLSGTRSHWHAPGQHILTSKELDRQAKQMRSAQAGVADAVTGYREIKNIGHDPVAGGIALAGLFPGVGKVGKIGEEIAKGADAARGISAADRAAANAAKAERVAKAASEAQGLKRAVLARKAVRLTRRTTPEQAQKILEQTRQDAMAKALKAARKNPAFLEHLPGETRPETGGAVGLKVREAMRGAKRIYKKEKELQQPETLKRTAMLEQRSKAATNFEEQAAAQGALAGELPKAEFHNFESLKPHLEEIRSYVNSLNMRTHDRNRLINAIKAGVEGTVPRPAERKLIESVFGKEVRSLSPEAIKDRGIVRTLTDVANIPRAIMSAGDLSAALRQNLAATFYDPLGVLRGYHETLHAAISQSEYERLMARDVQGSRYYHMSKADGVAYTEPGEHLNQREEAFPSNMAEELHTLPGVRSTPGLKQAAHGVSAVVKGSDRNYILFLNRTRARLYESMIEQAAANGWRLDGPAGEKLRKEIADTVNTLTGRGSLNSEWLKAHRATFNALFFSPGLMKSRVNLLNPLWYLRASPFARQQRMKAALRLYGTLSIVLASLKANGVNVGTNPTSANFGKIVWGNTRIDLTGGISAYIRLIGQLYEGRITSSVTGLSEPISNGPFKTSYGNVLQQFARNKFSPMAGLAYDIAYGPGFGQKVNAKSVAGSLLVPLLAQDMYQITRAKGAGGGPGAAAELFLPDLFGVGVQNYGAPPSLPSSSNFGNLGPSGSTSNSSFGPSGGSSSSFGP